MRWENSFLNRFSCAFHAIFAYVRNAIKQQLTYGEHSPGERGMASSVQQQQDGSLHTAFVNSKSVWTVKNISWCCLKPLKGFWSLQHPAVFCVVPKVSFLPPINKIKFTLFKLQELLSCCPGLFLPVIHISPPQILFPLCTAVTWTTRRNDKPRSVRALDRDILEYFPLISKAKCQTSL